MLGNFFISGYARAGLTGINFDDFDGCGHSSDGMCAVGDGFGHGDGDEDGDYQQFPESHEDPWFCCSDVNKDGDGGEYDIP